MNKIIMLFFIVLTLPTQAINVTFINPSYKGSPFWQQVSEVAIAAANDLNINFNIVYSDGHRLYQKEEINKILAQNNKPDYIIFLPYDGTALETFNKLEQAKIPFITLERSIFPELRKKLGEPRQHYKYWLGEIYHDTKKAGRLLAKALMKASKRSLINKKHYTAVGISGDISGHSNKRNAGLRLEIDRDNYFSLAQIVNARWDRGIAEQVFTGLLRRYPDVHLVWASSDTMALGVISAAKKQGRVVNKDLFVGGFDWTVEALIAIKNDQYTASVGGHFMQTAWALIKIYDHHNGKQVFFNNLNKPTYQLKLINTDNIDNYTPLLFRPNWGKVNFQRFSLSKQPQLTNYQFDFSNVLVQLK